MILDDRSTGAGDCFIVTGSLAPQFRPLVYRTKTDALSYAEEIRKFEKSEGVFPQFRAVIEDRWWSEMNPNCRREAYTPEGAR